MFKRSALSALALLGVSLGGPSRAWADESLPGKLEIGADYFRAADGTELPMRSWLPTGKPRALLVALHGFADYSASYSKPGNYWARHGVATFAYDQRGFGAAPHVLHWSSTATMVADTTQVVTAVRARYPGVPTYLIGESMGGAVAIAASTGLHPANVDGMILVSPAVWEHSLLGTIERSALWIAQMTVPGLWLSAPPGLHIRPSDNIEMLRAMGRDSLVQLGARADTTAGLMDLMDKAGDDVARIRLPTLVLFGAHEEVLPHSAVTSFLSRLPAGNIRVAMYSNGFHMLLRDLDGGIVANDVLAWIDDRSAPLPSGGECKGEAAKAAPCRHSP
ncbi:MAG: putative lysophospholipase [Rhodospirillales bacterium]|nr:putative lysophospholipase [Rhodospirillales bacterium]